METCFYRLFSNGVHDRRMNDSAASSDDQFAVSRRHLEAALDDPALRTEAHYLLWEVCQAGGDPEAALRHLDLAIRRDPLRTRHVPGAKPVRSVLALATPGDFQANLPLAMLLDGSTLLHTLWIADARAVLADPRAAIPDHLPPIDCVFIAISEDSRHVRALQAADALAQALGRPTINRGSGIASLSRDGASRLLAGLPDTRVPAQRLGSCGDLRAEPPPFPFIVRPQASHAGRALARIDDRTDLDAYLSGLPDDDLLYVAPFVDFRSRDGLFRKFRIVFVDRVPYPVHLAIHDDWAIWYYNAQMDRAAWKRAEEARFMADMDAALGARAMAALHAVARRIDLDYVGLDGAVLPDGRLLVFEIETGMIVHDHDPAELFPYKKRFIPRIFAAVADLIDRRMAPLHGSSPRWPG